MLPFRGSSRDAGEGVEGRRRHGLQPRPALRAVTPSIPPRVDYALTDLGRSLQAPVVALGQWALENRGRIEAARAAFDARED